MKGESRRLGFEKGWRVLTSSSGRPRDTIPMR